MQGLGSTKNIQPLPLVVIGCGLVGVRFTENWLALNTGTPVVMFGAEPHTPYDRIRLGKVLEAAGSDNFHTDDLSLSLPGKHPRLRLHLQQTVIRIDPATQTVYTASGLTQTYSRLILATGANAYIPDIEGIHQPGVHTLRTLDDALAIRAQLPCTRQVAILGGGLLGVETALNLLTDNREVHIIEYRARILAEQDEATYQQSLKVLQQHNSLHIHTNSQLKRLLGTTKIRAVTLEGGLEIACDLLILATGIRANIKLAQTTGLLTNRGIVIDDQLQTSIEGIFAIGDCAEHQGVLYGVVSPGYEQAAILARHLNGEQATYQGSRADPRPKLSNPSPALNGQSVSQWPETSMVCECNGITRGELSLAIRNGSHDMDSLRSSTGAGNNCGSCRPLLSELLGSRMPSPREQILQAAAFLAIFTGLLYLILPGLSYQNSVMVSIQWDELWRNSLSRQITGFSLLTISAMISVIAVRKRLRGFRWGEFSSWRNSHVVLGLLIMVILLIHTGARFGDNLNLVLMVCFIGVLLSGGLLGASIANQHRLKADRAHQVRLGSLWLHLFLLWPLPALLLFHILKSYYF